MSTTASIGTWVGTPLLPQIQLPSPIITSIHPTGFSLHYCPRSLSILNSVSLLRPFPSHSQVHYETESPILSSLSFSPFSFPLSLTAHPHSLSHSLKLIALVNTSTLLTFCLACLIQLFLGVYSPLKEWIHYCLSSFYSFQDCVPKDCSVPPAASEPGRV